MLDVARHFFKMEDVMRCIDLMANYKMNVMDLFRFSAVIPSYHLRGLCMVSVMFV